MTRTAAIQMLRRNLPVPANGSTGPSVSIPRPVTEGGLAYYDSTLNLCLPPQKQQ
jgi:hypothetical protein